MFEDFILIGRAALALGLVLFSGWLIFNFGLATFEPAPFWWGIAAPVCLVAAWKVWPPRLDR